MCVSSGLGSWEEACVWGGVGSLHRPTAPPVPAPSAHSGRLLPASCSPWSLQLRLRPLTRVVRSLQRQVEVSVRNKILHLIQAWAHAFRNEPKYKVVQDTYQIMKVEGGSRPGAQGAAPAGPCRVWTAPDCSCPAGLGSARLWASHPRGRAEGRELSPKRRGAWEGGQAGHWAWASGVDGVGGVVGRPGEQGTWRQA